jgi:hypothetical protein
MVNREGEKLCDVVCRTLGASRCCIYSSVQFTCTSSTVYYYLLFFFFCRCCCRLVWCPIGLRLHCRRYRSGGALLLILDFQCHDTPRCPQSLCHQLRCLFVCVFGKWRTGMRPGVAQFLCFGGHLCHFCFAGLLPREWRRLLSLWREGTENTEVAKEGRQESSGVHALMSKE